jgi:hypothetical protein
MYDRDDALSVHGMVALSDDELQSIRGGGIFWKVVGLFCSGVSTIYNWAKDQITEPLEEIMESRMS